MTCDLGQPRVGVGLFPRQPGVVLELLSRPVHLLGVSGPSIVHCLLSSGGRRAITEMLLRWVNDPGR